MEVLRLDADDEADASFRRHELADPGDLPNREIERREVKQTIEHVIGELPEEARIVVILRDIQGLTYEDIAETINCSIGTVKSRLSRARLKVKDKLTREGLTCAVKR